MILVTLGTQDKPFARLLRALDAHCASGALEDAIVVQAGFTRFESSHLKIVPYFTQAELDALRADAELIITHGGVGSLLDGLRLHKPVIGVARLKAYKEHLNDHQLEILKQFSDQGHILWCEDFDDLPQLIKRAKTFKPRPYPFDNHALLAAIEADLADL